MDGIPLKQLANDLDLSVDRLTAELKVIGVEVENEDEVIPDPLRIQLMGRLGGRGGGSQAAGDISLETIHSATSLLELNQLLTRAMADRKIQALIKGDNLDAVVNKVLERNVDSAQELVAAVTLGRLAAVARGRAERVLERADDVFSRQPPSIQTLEDGDAKAYAAGLLAHCTDDWVSDYACREALVVDTADNARRQLLETALARQASIADWLEAITRQAHVLQGLENGDTRLRRIRRITGVMCDVVQGWRGEVGVDCGQRLAEWLAVCLVGRLQDLEQALLAGVIDNQLALLRRIIELRFSNALHATTYDLLSRGKQRLGPGAWGRFLGQSVVLPDVRVALLEAALVLARQNRQDREIMARLLACYTSKPQVSAAIKRHFKHAKDLDSNVHEWWKSAGSEPEGGREVEHKIGNNEDSQIGALLIEVEGNREAMNKLGRAVVPLLEISEPVLASTVKKAVGGYQGIAQTTRRLARMRRLTKTDLEGQRLEYNPQEHEMLGGHKPGVRRVRVVRDGIKKEFGGKIKTLVRPWVELEEE